MTRPTAPWRAPLVLLTSMMLVLTAWTGLTPGAAQAAYDSATGTVSPVPPDTVQVAGGSATYTLDLLGESTVTSTPTDIVLALDESGSIDSTEFNQERQFAIDVVNGLAAAGLFDNGGTLGVVGFAGIAQTVIPPTSDPADAVAAIQGNPQSGGNTCLSCAVRLSSDLFPVPGTGHHRILLLLTDGNPTSGTGDEAGALAESDALDVERFVIGVGGGVNTGVLNTFATDPDSTHVFSVGGFEALDSILTGLVEAVVEPGETTIAWDLVIDDGFEITGVSTSLGSASFSGQTVTWTIPELGEETATLTIETSHRVEDGCGPRDLIRDAAGYSSDQGTPAPTIDPGTVEVAGCPICDDVAPSRDVLWPPNGKFRQITLSGATDSDGDTLTYDVLGVTSDEPVRTGGRQGPDARINDAGVELRAERLGPRDGRVYEITYEVGDGTGATCGGAVEVGVPHDQRGVAAFDSGQLYDATSP